MTKIAVVGAGLFGVTVATKLSPKYSVDLFEKEKNILSAASGINQFRLHRGYHYPRSRETVTSLLSSLAMFKREYGKTLIPGIENFYAIASKKSLTSAEAYKSFLVEHGLEFQKETLELIDRNSIDLCIKVKEDILNPDILKKICIGKIKASRVNLMTSRKAGKSIFNKYDFIVICSYANSNDLIEKNAQMDYQFEVCEKIVVELPLEFKNKSIVILDGPFMCVDPYGSSGMFLMGNVDHAIHQSNIGKFPLVDARFKKLLNRGIIKNPPITNFKKFIESAKIFMPLIEKAQYRGSMFTIRCVLPYKEKTDERPTLVSRLDNKTFTVFSGKLVSCVSAAEIIKKLIES